MRLFLLGIAILFCWAFIMDLAVQAMRKNKKKKGEESITPTYRSGSL